MGGVGVSGLVEEVVCTRDHVERGRAPTSPPGVDESFAAVEGQDLVYGQSITDACIDFDDTEILLRDLATAVRTRRARLQE